MVLLVACALSVAAADEVWVLRIEGEITTGTVTYLRDGLKNAEAAQADMVVLILSTPGGALNAGVTARDLLLDAEIPTVAFVNREALSAGALIALACDRIVFAPGGVLGAATPVLETNDWLREAPEKIISAVRTIFKATAELHGRIPEVAEAMVDRDVVISGLIDQGKLLTLTAVDAANVGYSDGEAGSTEEILALFHQEAVPLIEYDPQWSDRVIQVLTMPLIAGLLIVIGLIGLVIEMMVPGFGVFGLIGLCCLGAFFWSHFLVGLAGWESLGFLLAGVIAILLEVFAFTAVDFGIAGLIGLVLIGLGFYTAMLGPLSSSTQMGQAIAIIAGGLLISLTAIVIVLTRLPKTRLRLGGVILSSAVTGGAFRPNREAQVQNAWVGKQGIAVTDLHPVGAGEVDKDRIDVVCGEGFLPKGTRIIVIKDEGYRKVVRKQAD